MTADGLAFGLGRGRVGAVCLVALTWTASVPASAAPPAKITAQEHEATALATQAKARYAARDYEEAARLFMQAYGKLAEPTLVFNAARAYQQAGRLREALPLFQLYLSVNHDSDADSRAGRAEASQHVAAIQAELTRQGKPLPPAPDPPQPTPKPPQDKPPARDPALPTDPPPPLPAVEPPTSEPPAHQPHLFERVEARPEQRRSYRSAAWISGGAGLGLLLTGALLRSIASSGLSDLDARLAADAATLDGVTVHPLVTQKQADGEFSSHRHQQIAGNVLITAGLLGIGTGVALWLLQEPGTPAAQARLVPVLHGTPDGASVALAGWF